MASAMQSDPAEVAMLRVYLAGIVAVLALAAAPTLAEPDEQDSSLPPIEHSGARSAVEPTPEPGPGDVSVDLEESTPGLNEEVFRSTLAPYGDWNASPRYGSVWRPRVAAGWRPYYFGSWLWTDEGWYWSSDEPFSWAVYHYGRWVWDPAWEWVWVPGYQWAPAWVTWRFGADAVGWAPLGPGVSVFVTSYPFIDFWWTFVPTYRFAGVPVYTVAYGPRDAHRHFRGTAPAPPRSPAPRRDGRSVAAPVPAWGGPSRVAIEERSGHRIETFRRAPATRPDLDERRERGGGRGAPAARGERPSVEERDRRRDEERRPAVRQTPRDGGEEHRTVRPSRSEDRGSSRPAPPRGGGERGRSERSRR
jgi:hypothetical protein